MRHDGHILQIQHPSGSLGSVVNYRRFVIEVNQRTHTHARILQRMDRGAVCRVSPPMRAHRKLHISLLF
jgi:hypothetical protein